MSRALAVRETTGRAHRLDHTRPHRWNPELAAIAVTGNCVFSFGNGTIVGSSLRDYLLLESPRRETTVFVIPTTREQDTAVLEFLSQFPSPTLPGDWLSTYFTENCSVRTNSALDSAGVPIPYGVVPVLGLCPVLPNVPGSAGLRAIGADATPYLVPRRSTTLPPLLRQFEPN